MARVVFQRKVPFPIKFKVGEKVIDLKPGEWLLILDDGQICGWTAEKTAQTVQWAQSGGTLPMPEID